MLECFPILDLSVRLTAARCGAAEAGGVRALRYLALLAPSADLSQPLECECEKHALVVSLACVSRPMRSHLCHTHTPSYHTHTWLMSALANSC